jgi:hypothetical protein
MLLQNISQQEIFTRQLSATTTYKDDDDEIDYAILEAVGLIKRVETDFFDGRIQVANA